MFKLHIRNQRLRDKCFEPPLAAAISKTEWNFRGLKVQAPRARDCQKNGPAIRRHEFRVREEGEPKRTPPLHWQQTQVIHEVTRRRQQAEGPSASNINKLLRKKEH